MKQLTSILVLHLYIATALGNVTISQRIFMGKEATPNSIPYQVLLRINQGAVEWTCSGSLITSNFVLTSASCTTNAFAAAAYFEKHHYYEPDADKYCTQIKNIIIHPGFQLATLQNDIALLQLEKPVKLGPNIRLIRLADIAEINNHFVGRMGLVSGWGATNDGLPQSPYLKQLDVQIYKPEYCEQTFGNRDWGNYVCAVGVDGGNICPGDSGGPLAIPNENYSAVQIGIVSFGLRTGCGNGGPHVYTRTIPFMNWIMKYSDYRDEKNL